jgi:glycolate oxidase FAD binding subunit
MPNSISLQTFADDLAAISGPEHLRVDDNTFSIAPANTEEIAAVLRYANTNGISVAPCGGGTKQSWGNSISPSLILHTHRLNTVREHTWQDMTCIVQAGCVWSSLQESLAKHGQFVALDPLWPDRATIGGIAAINDSGSLRLRYGSLRDLIIGMTIVLADGTIARTGGKVVKNVAGYDLHKLMTGAFGTLGVITEVNFRLHSIPRHVQSFTIASQDMEPLGQILLKILDSHLSTILPTSLQPQRIQSRRAPGHAS